MLILLCGARDTLCGVMKEDLVRLLEGVTRFLLRSLSTGPLEELRLLLFCPVAEAATGNLDMEETLLPDDIPDVGARDLDCLDIGAAGPAFSWLCLTRFGGNTEPD